MTIEIARDRMAALVEVVQRARAHRDELRAAGGDDAALRAAEAELAIQREALEAARGDVARIERRAKAQAQEVLDRALRDLAVRLRAEVDAVLAGALALRRAVALARGRNLRTPSGTTLPADAERLLEGWRYRLRLLAGEVRAGEDDAA